MFASLITQIYIPDGWYFIKFDESVEKYLFFPKRKVFTSSYIYIWGKKYIFPDTQRQLFSQTNFPRKFFVLKKKVGYQLVNVTHFYLNELLHIILELILVKSDSFYQLINIYFAFKTSKSHCFSNSCMFLTERSKLKSCVTSSLYMKCFDFFS